MHSCGGGVGLVELEWAESGPTEEQYALGRKSMHHLLGGVSVPYEY